MKPTTAQLAAALIAVFEGPERLTAFRDSGGAWTIGRGHTAGVKEGDTCTHEQAVAWFAQDQAPLLSMVSDRPPLAAAAYSSFGYNCGRGALANVLAGKDTILNPKHATDRHGVTQPGLVSRRALEAILIEAA
jgi:lysozyme